RCTRRSASPRSAGSCGRWRGRTRRSGCCLPSCATSQARPRCRAEWTECSNTRLSAVEQRTLGRTGQDVSIVGLGTWQLGADWGEVGEPDALAVLGAAVDAGVTFLDTADVYGDGRSEQLIGRFLKARPERLFVATKMGRRVDQQPENYTAANFRDW